MLFGGKQKDGEMEKKKKFLCYLPEIIYIFTHTRIYIQVIKISVKARSKSCFQNNLQRFRQATVYINIYPGLKISRGRMGIKSWEKVLFF